MDFEIITSTEQARVPVTIMFVYGNLDTTTYQSFQSKAEELIREGAKYILVDLENVPYMSSAGLRALHAIFNQLRTVHKDANDETLRQQMSAGAYKSPYLKLCNAAEPLKEVFETGGFDTYIQIFSDRNKALKSF